MGNRILDLDSNFGKEGCGICAGFGESVRTPFGVNDKTREEVLCFQGFPISNPVDKDLFVYI